MVIPDELRYTKEHEWIRLDADGKLATVGITDFAQQELGDVVYVELKEEGTTLAQDEAFGTVEAVKTVSELYMPVAGKIVEVNTQLDSNPELVNEDPYGAGWMIRIEVENAESIESLLTAEAYSALIG
jgi:glycine cleavage system H protein